ncbi:MAG: hypothetical protein ACXABY_37445 [Candidatus Thorarchaeota archaeon]|jgi:hypothetical protein
MQDFRDRINYENLKKYDIIEKLEPLVNQGTLVYREDGKFHFRGEVGLTVKTPWIFARQPNPLKAIDCMKWHQLFFNQLGFMPAPCLSCYKVTIKPRKLTELFALHDLQLNHWDGPCKCGVEPRDYVHRNYGGYFYNYSLEEGQENYPKIKELCAQLIHPDMPVILKRGCTEFEQKFGDSCKWEESITEESLRWAELVEEMIVFPNTHSDQPDALKRHIMRFWIDFAYDRGDSDALIYNNGEHLHPQYSTYHNDAVVDEFAGKT